MDFPLLGQGKHGDRERDRPRAIFTSSSLFAWCPQQHKIEGVGSTVSGLIGGGAEGATYERASPVVQRVGKALFDPGYLS